MYLSTACRPAIDTGNLHDGMMIGNDRKTDRNFRNSLLDFGCCLVAGCKEIDGRTVNVPPSAVEAAAGESSFTIGGGGGAGGSGGDAISLINVGS